MSYVILRPADFIAEPDLDDLNLSCLTDNARYLFERHTNVYYGADIECNDINRMEKLK